MQFQLFYPVRHVLLDDLTEVWNHDNEQNDEVIWSVQYSEDQLLWPGNNSHLYFRPWFEVYNDGLNRALGHGYGRPWIRLNPTPWLLENFRPLDVDSRFEKNFQSVWYYNTTSNIPEGASVGDTAIWVTDEYLTQADVDIYFILDERSRELFGEYSRWKDLKKNGKLIERVRKYNPDLEADNIRDIHVLRPIPANQLIRT